ncbi:hypothetical protein M885DRAFT_533831 [Pelagophyceae sp. CCMP2097]|nr:hypothetical protein M885DRAFT_533831 [Pelagophyceae sp. CCMP2097]
MEAHAVASVDVNDDALDADVLVAAVADDVEASGGAPGVPVVAAAYDAVEDDVDDVDDEIARLQRRLFELQSRRAMLGPSADAPPASRRQSMDEPARPLSLRRATPSVLATIGPRGVSPTMIDDNDDDEAAVADAECVAALRESDSGGDLAGVAEEIADAAEVGDATDAGGLPAAACPSGGFAAGGFAEAKEVDGGVPVALPVASCVDDADSAVADPLLLARPQSTPLWVASAVDEHGFRGGALRGGAPVADVDEARFRVELERAVEQSLTIINTRRADASSRDAELQGDGDDDSDSSTDDQKADDAPLSGSRRRRRWHYTIRDGHLVHHLAVEERFPTDVRHAPRGFGPAVAYQYQAQSHDIVDERVPLARIGRWFRDVDRLTEHDARYALLDAARPADAPADAQADALESAPDDADDAAATLPDFHLLPLLVVRDLIRSSTICGGEWRHGPTHDAELRIGVGDLVRFRLRGSAAVDEYGVVVHVSMLSYEARRVDRGNRSGAHIQARAPRPTQIPRRRPDDDTHEGL